MRLKIYQIDVQKDKDRVVFLDHETTQSKGGIDPSIYRCVYSGSMPADDEEDVFQMLNSGEGYPGTYQGRSLSVSDVIENMDEGKCSFCDFIGWKEIPFDTSQCAGMEGLRVLMLQPGEEPAETWVKDELSSWQRAVSDHGEDALIEVTYPFDSGVAAVGNEEAKLIGMEGNRHIEGEVYAGPLFLVGCTCDGGFRSLTNEEIKTYSDMFAEPEQISDAEVQAHTGFMLFGFGDN